MDLSSDVRRAASLRRHGKSANGAARRSRTVHHVVNMNVIHAGSMRSSGHGGKPLGCRYSRERFHMRAELFCMRKVWNTFDTHERWSMSRG